MSSDVNDDALDRVLSGSEEIVPSSGFAASVMDAVRQEAAEPAPIPFPWKWALPGLIASIALIVFFFVRFAHANLHRSYGAAAGLRLASLISALPHGVSGASILLAVEWSAVALLMSFLAVWLSMRIARE